MKKLLVLVFAIALCLGVLCLGASADGIMPSKPAQDADGVYQIGTVAELYWFAGLVNGTLTDGTAQNTAAHAKLTDDITIQTGVLAAIASGRTPTYTWTPICTDYNKAYTGTFDGNDKTISGLYYSGSGNYVGLFGYVGSGGRVQNVKVADSYISNSEETGRTGGVCGCNRGTITNCSFAGSVTVTGSRTYTYVGGVCGDNYSGTITNCNFAGSVTVTGTGNVGGVCGYNSGTITNCYNTGTVEGSYYTGGVCAANSGMIMNCYNTGSVTGTGTVNYVGGVCGENYNRGTITNCYNTGTVTGTDNVGGVCGYNGATIMNCYNTGSVNGSGNYTGGVCGRNGDTITNCYWLTGMASSGIGTGTGEATYKTTTEFDSGEVAWLLNRGQANGPWRQNLSGTDVDEYPVLGAAQSDTIVHKKADGGYENSDHDFGDNGFCKKDDCSACQSAALYDGVYQIGNAGQLYWFAEKVNGGEYDADAVLMTDITINTGVLGADGSLNRDGSSFTQWTPIGNNSTNAYTGTFNGDGHTISGLYYSGSSDYVGLFGYVGSNGRVQNVNVVDSYISNSHSNSCAGGVCGQNDYGELTNCSFAGSVTGTGSGTYTYVGGVCGNNYSGTITNCNNTGTVTGTGTDNRAYVGGVCGNNYSGTITNCYKTGSVTGSVTGTNDRAYAGGVCGYNSGTIMNCYNTGSVTGTNDRAYAGGVCGGNNNRGTITNCYNTGTVTGTGNVGSVCGYNGNYSTITNCYWLSGKASDINATEKTADQFASGEVAWLLNSYQENGPWRQTLDEDDYPVLNSNHGSVIKVTVQNETSTDYYGNGNHVTLPDPSPNKAYFNSSNEYIDPASYSFTDGETVYLKAAVKVTVVYDNGTADTKEQVVDGGSFKLPETPSKSGYYFVGWSDGNTTYKAGAMVENITADTTFTAVWREINIPDPNSITVTQPANGTIRVNPSNGSAGTLITVTATPDEGYELAYITVDGEKITGNTFRMPDKSVTVSAVFVPATFPFVDVKTGDWFYDYVAYVYSNGLMDGTSATTFEPNANMTRAMVWAILARIDGETVTGAAWATDARAWAMAEGVSDGTDPNGLVTREQFATMLYRYAVAKGYDVSIGESTNILSYADFASISEYAIPAMQWVCGSGIVTGVTDSTLAPQGTATRAQCAAMLMRFVEL